METQTKSVLFPFILALVVGSLINIGIDAIPLDDTDIPAQGYHATVVFTEDYSATTGAAYAGFLLLKGLVYVGSFYLFLKIWQIL
ncbi:MAG: hypothetical protein H6850_00625 [Alphaproteobacteria bacterium]|nr:MAG: hypothetical protein H6850_00625 [Alphaproteobacteria bacterium]